MNLTFEQLISVLQLLGVPLLGWIVYELRQLHAATGATAEALAAVRQWTVDHEALDSERFDAIKGRRPARTAGANRRKRRK